MTIDGELDLTVSRVIRAPRSAVWEAWTKAEYLEQWWAPVPVVTTIHKYEFHAGGGFASTMKLEDGTEFSGEGCFLEIAEQERIVWTDALRGGWRLNDEGLFTAIVTFEEHAEGTQYIATAMHRNGADRQKHADMGFEHGWGTVIEQLGRFAETL